MASRQTTDKPADIFGGFCYGLDLPAGRAAGYRSEANKNICVNSRLSPHRSVVRRFPIRHKNSQWFSRSKKRGMSSLSGSLSKNSRMPGEAGTLTLVS